MFIDKSLLSNEIYSFYPPVGRAIGLLSIPHSGEIIPDEFKKYLVTKSSALNADVDYKVPDLIDIDEMTNSGIAVLISNIHRVCIDLNRQPKKSLLNWNKNTKGEDLVIERPSDEIGQRLIDFYYTPYYEAIDLILKEIQVLNDGRIIPVVDLHSMPSKPTDYHLSKNPFQKLERPDICVSDLEGKSCSFEFISYVVDAFLGVNLKATANDPYLGGHITKFISEHVVATNNVQVEIKRGIYMDEIKRELLSEKVQTIRNMLNGILKKVYSKFS